MRSVVPPTRARAERPAGGGRSRYGRVAGCAALAGSAGPAGCRPRVEQAELATVADPLCSALRAARQAARAGSSPLRGRGSGNRDRQERSAHTSRAEERRAGPPLQDDCSWLPSDAVPSSPASSQGPSRAAMGRRPKRRRNAEGTFESCSKYAERVRMGPGAQATGSSTSADTSRLVRTRTARTVDGHHLRPPCAVGTVSWLSARAISASPRPRACSNRMRSTTCRGSDGGRPGVPRSPESRGGSRCSRRKRSSSATGISL